MSALELIGAVCVGLAGLALAVICLGLVRETISAFRQACRVARYLYGRKWRSKLVDRRYAKWFAKEWWRQMSGGEFMIGSIVFPADPSKPLRRTWTRD